MTPAMMVDLRDLPWPLYLLAWAIVATPFAAGLALAIAFWCVRRRLKRRAGSLRKPPASRE